MTTPEAVLGGAVGAVVQVAAQRLLDNRRGRRLDPPSVTIVLQLPTGSARGSFKLRRGVGARSPVLL